MDLTNPPRSAYIHVPFCRHRCGYCNFTLIAGRDDLIEAYLVALEQELRLLETPRPVETLFLGGGTPTHLRPDQLEKLLALVLDWHPLLEGYEFSVEANPADVDPERMAVLVAAGVTRISLGAQSFNAQKLALLERDHRRAEIEHAVALARVNLSSVSLDLIFGAPGETVEKWEADLTAALACGPDHVSTYGLTFERGTAFWSRLLKGDLARVEEGVEADLYALAIDKLTAAGFEHYEVSNFARPGQRCRHNEAYWSGVGYFAAGPGAARYVAGRREMNHRSTTTWIRRLAQGESPIQETETLPPEDKAREALVFGLRRLEGVDRATFQARTGYTIDELVGKELAHFVELKLLADNGRRVHLTRAGLFVSDAMWPKFLR